MFPFPITQTAVPGENWMWAIYPFPGDYDHSVRVNLLIDTKKHPPEYAAPVIEISGIRIHDPAELRSVRTALDQAELKVLEWAEHEGEIVYV